MISKRYGILLLLLLKGGKIESQDATSCSSSQNDCQSCIQAHPSCSWCSERANIEVCNPQRCRTLSENEKLCSPGQLQYPVNVLNIFEDKVFDSSAPNSGVAPTHLRPQKVSLSLRPGTPQKVNATLRRVADPPLDIYYVMDLSNSMKDDLQMIKTLGGGLVEKIQNFTNNARLGFGSFVDKVALPFTDTHEIRLNNPCFENEEGQCAPPFGFRHQLPLTANASSFKEAVNVTRISGNLDSPEGGFDALVQIALCKEQIDWRDESLRVILFATDSSPHLAMDGKLANIFELNDMKCHMESGVSSFYPHDMMYSRSKQMDYPSVGQLKKVLLENNIQIIFSVTENVLPIYQKISALLGNAVANKLAADSSNIIDVISTSYDVLRNRISMKPPTPPSNLQLEYRILCPGKTWEPNSLSCERVLIGEEVMFEFEFKATNCPNPKSDDVIIISPTGSTGSLDRMTVSIAYICGCPCEGTIEQNSTLCGRHGNYQCGQCECGEGFSGEKCHCQDNLGGTPLSQSCTSSKHEEGGALCSGNGCCECGNCTCNTGYFGDFCQCTHVGCPEYQNQICGGKEQGVCINCAGNPACACNQSAGWYPDNFGVCTCNNHFCMKEDGDENATLCLGRGTCSCRRCDCSKTDAGIAIYEGQYCETCVHPQCMNGTCDDVMIRECALCVHENDRLNKDVVAYCQSFCQDQGIGFHVVEAFSDCDKCLGGNTTDSCLFCRSFTSDPSFHTPTLCFADTPVNDCKAWYKIAWETSRKSFSVIVRSFSQERDCFNIDVLAVVVGITGGMVLIGLIILIIWKIQQTIIDKRLYQAYLKEAAKSKSWHNRNPIFQSPITRTTNPKYVGMAPTPPPKPKKN